MRFSKKEGSGTELGWKEKQTRQYERWCTAHGDMPLLTSLGPTARLSSELLYVLVWCEASAFDSIPHHVKTGDACCKKLCNTLTLYKMRRLSDTNKYAPYTVLDAILHARHIA